MKKINRKKYFEEIFKSKRHTIESIAEEMGMKRDSLYRKIIGKRGFSEADIKKILNILNLKFEEVFIDMEGMK